MRLERLVNKLRRKEIHPQIVAVLASWLQQRFAEVVVGGASSRMMTLMNMVYQGTVSGPLLWNLFFEDARHAINETFFKEVESKHGALQIVVVSSGIRADSIVGMMKTEDWRNVIDTNLTGTFNICKLSVQAMMRQKYGRIITLTSPIGKFGFAGQANYAASKAGQVALVKSLSKEVASRKITVNCVSPGFIDTDFISDLPDEQKNAYKKQIPLKIR